MTDGERVYAYFGNLGMFTYDMKGKLLWSKKWGPFKTRYGWHIVQMLGTRTYDSTDDMRRQRAFAWSAPWRMRRAMRRRDSCRWSAAPTS